MLVFLQVCVGELEGAEELPSLLFVRSPHEADPGEPERRITHAYRQAPGTGSELSTWVVCS